MSEQEQRTKALKQNLGLEIDLAASINQLCNYLEGSEFKLVELMVHNNIWQGTVPAKPNDEGSVEFGLVPYWVHNPPSFIEQYFAKHFWFKELWSLLTNYYLPTHISSENYQALMARAKTEKGVVADDGTIYGEGKYEQLDTGWFYSFLNYLIVHYGKDRAPFANTPAKPIALTGARPGKVRLGILGDWGTGKWQDGKQPRCPSEEIMAQMLAMKPDYIIHLGDVYYAGTGGDFLPLHEEQKNLLDVWPPAAKFPAGRSFTLNSNHEMYSGAKGYYLALADARFGAQSRVSYFALQYAGWTLLGLDSGYFSNAPLFMEGSIGGADGLQGRWIKSLGLDPGKTLVMTHHNALETNGSGIAPTPSSPQGSLWKEVGVALGGDPGYWYWGHVHNGIVYKTPNVNGSNTQCRCVGHSAIPFGVAWGISTPQVEWFAHDLNPRIDNGVRVNNGFALMDIIDDGKVHESIWAQGNTGKPVWASDGYKWDI